MIGVIIAASDRDRKMWGTLPGILERNFPIIPAQGETPGAEDDDGVLCMCTGGEIERLRTDSAVIIYKDGNCAPGCIPAGLNAVAVVDSGNPSLMELVSATKLPAITCGLSPRDTLTLTSFGEDSAVLGLQRSVTCFDGAVAEPQEIPLKLGGPIDSYTLMASSSVFILSGNIARLKYADFQVC